MWRHIYYDKKSSEIHERTWDEEGNRITRVREFSPFCFVETKAKTKYKSIFGTYLEPKTFKNANKRYHFVENTEDRVFYNLPPEQQYAIAAYRKKPQEEFSKNPIRVFYLDIEAPSQNEFPDPRHAKYEIDLMTIYDSLTGIYHMWGKNPWDKSKVKETLDKLNREKDETGGKLKVFDESKIEYYHIEDEKKRLFHVLGFWEANYPDVYSGWNIDGFDTPYLINRMKLLLPRDEFKRLSPYLNVTSKDGFDKFGNPELRYNIHGINVMDYMSVFGTFTFNAERESWKLDDVASDILKCGKVSYTQSNLYNLSQEDWATYSLYNLVDVALLVSLDAELEFMETGRATAYEGFSNFVDCLGKIRTITGSIAASALDSGKFIETKRRSQNVPFEGGFVKEPKVGLASNIFTYDVTSLYPTNMLALGVSPETKVGTITAKDQDYTYYSNYGVTTKVKNDEFKAHLEEKNYCVSSAGVLFDQNKVGVVNDFVSKQFNNKQTFSKLADQARKEGNEELAAVYDRRAKITKIFLNSCYGIISAASSPLYDLDIARSITLTGQNAIKKAIETANKFATKCGVTDEEIVFGGDTDSVFISFTSISEKVGKPLFDKEGITPFGLSLSETLGALLNSEVNKWARNELNCNNPKYNFGREKAAKTALFFAKKQYAYYVVNNEGFDLPEEKRMKYTGLKVIKSEFSPMVKRMFNELYYETLANYLELGHAPTRARLVDVVKRHKEEFFNASFFDVSKRQKANNIMLYADGGTKVDNNGDTKVVEGFSERYTSGKGCPAQVKACVFHNRIIEDKKLGHKYQPLQGGVKALWTYVKPNEWGIENIAGNDGKLPEEFNVEIDYEKQWEKLYLAVAQQLFETVEWIFPNLIHEELVDFDELFG